MGRRVSSYVLLLVAVLGLAACAITGHAGHAGQDGVAERLATAISYPRQSDAISWARAAVGTTNGSGPVVVLRAEDLAPGSSATAPSARLLFSVHRAATQDVFGEHAASDTCYSLGLNRYGAIGSPRRVGCPSVLTPLRIPPAPPRSQIPVGFDKTLTGLLQPAPEGAEALRTAVLARLPSPAARVEVTADAQGVGVAVQDESGGCLFGARSARGVRVYYPPHEMVRPGELPCDADSARGPVVRPAH